MTVVTDWYCNQTIMMTGGTGFMGKVVLEKLLRTCSGICRIYILVRPRHDLDPSTRIEEMFKLPIFENLVKNSPEVLKKVTAVEADLTKPGLGLQQEYKHILISEVTLVFNIAASVRLGGALKAAVTHNTTGTKQVLDLCAKMKQLKVFIHFSTAFCHCDYEILEEKIYPPPHNPHDVMHAMEWLDDKSIEMITPRLLKQHPNSYTYSKRLAEYLVYEYRDRVPVCILRPAIVTPAYKEPIPGWVDTLNGPIGILVAAGKGVLRSMLCGSDYTAEMVPVDIVSNIAIPAAWKFDTEKTKEIPVYNLTASVIVPGAWGELLATGRKLYNQNPFENGVWYPDGEIRKNKLTHYLIIIFFQYLPAYFIDFLLLLARQKRFMVMVQKRISVGLEVLQYFTMKNWNFQTKTFRSLEDSMSEEDRNIFYITNIELDVENYFLNSILGTRVYCLKEPLSSLPRARRHLTMLYYLHCISKIAFYCFLIWLLLLYVDSARDFLNYSTEILHKVPVVGNLVPHKMMA